MALNDNTAPQTESTAREVALELGGFMKSLAESTQKLKTEAANIEQAKAGIAEELADNVSTFVKNTLTDLKGDKFDEITRIAQNVPELGAQSLSFTIKKMSAASDAALARVNAQLPETIDAEGFEQRYEQAKAKVQEATEKQQALQGTEEKAEGDLTTWRRSKEYSLVALDKDITEKGGFALNTDNRALYEPKGAWNKMWKWATKGGDYKRVREALKEYGHGEGGRDAFADLAGFKKKDETLASAVTAANDTLTAAGAAVRDAQTLANTFGSVAPQVKTEAELLAAAQTTVAGYFKTPQFVEAMAKQYGEDFPRGIPLMLAKIDTLDKLEEGVEAKMKTARENYQSVSDNYAKVSRVAPYKKLPVDIDDLQRRNRARIQEYDNYSSSANRCWTQTRSYSPPSTVVYVDNSPSFFQTMLMYDLLSSNRNYNYNEQNHRNDFVPAPDSSYTAGLMGLDRAQSADYNIPATVFDTSPEVKQQMADLGVDDYKTNDFLFDHSPASATNDNTPSQDSLFDTAISAAATPDYGSSRSSPGYTQDNSSLWDTKPSGSSYDRGYSNNNSDPDPTPSTPSTPSYGSPGSSGS